MTSDFHRVEFGSRAAPASERTVAAPDSVLVPLDQWNRLLNQLGNVHEAGQQLADARERMARAETENLFLKERIRDLRDKLDPNPLPDLEPEPGPPATGPAARPKRLQLEVGLPRWLSRRL